MTTLFWALADAAFAAGWAVLILILWRWLFGKRTPRWITVAMWAIVALRLVCPFSIESDVSLMPEPLSQTVYSVQEETVTSPTVSPSPDQPTAVPVLPEATPSIPWEAAACGVWLCGLLGMIGYTVVSYVRLKNTVRTATGREHNVYECETVSSPFILGIVVPRIYLPYAMEDAEREHALAHERAHIARGDHLLKPLGFLLLSVYWFHPLLWVAYILFCRDIEFACDERVIRDLSREERKGYSRALLSAAVDRRRVAMCPLAFGEVGVEARVKGIATYKKPVAVTVAIASAACILLGWWLMTDPPAPARTTLKDAYVCVTYEDEAVSEVNALLVEQGNRLSLHTASGQPLQMVIEEVSTEDMSVAVRFSQYGEEGRRIEVPMNKSVEVDTTRDEGRVSLQLHLPSSAVKEKDSLAETVYHSGDTRLRLYEDCYRLQCGEEVLFGTYKQTADTLILTQDARLTEYVLRADGNGGWRYDAKASYRHKKSAAPALSDGTLFRFAYRYELTRINQHYRFNALNANGQTVLSSYSAFGVRPQFEMTEYPYLQITVNGPAADPETYTMIVNVETGDLPHRCDWGDEE
ncbi:MAG: hypothetical protein E7553_02170 [Ruminococcaceae bacterium]|nr:hypothetical protein [Oscillospiraceae bacterium]